MRVTQFEGEGEGDSGGNGDSRGSEGRLFSQLRQS